MRETVKERLRCVTLREMYWIPHHDKRRVSSRFRKNKKFLRDHLELPCWICAKHGSKRNPLEVHHIFEWSLWNAIDPMKAVFILDCLEFYDETYIGSANGRRDELIEKLENLKGKPLQTPDDIRNLIVLCQEHHRLKYSGIHMISFPIWLALGVLKPGFRMIRRELIEGVKAISRVDEALSELVKNNR